MTQQALYDPEKRFKIPEDCLFKDTYDLVLEDKWAFMVVWGVQRTGKSTLALWIPYFFWRRYDPTLTEDELWERVYSSIVFNLSQLIYKLEDPNMLRVWDYKKQHYRIPIIIWDDFGAHSNKAVTQHEVAWDHFKGGFDVLGTQFGVIVATMANPEEPTAQIEHKYTHEVMLPERGLYKYDTVFWQQDYSGWRAKHDKQWQLTQTFQEIPWVRFQPYNDLRTGLADEVIERIKDSMAGRIPLLLRRLNDTDMTTLQELVNEGPMTEYKRKTWFVDEREKTENKLKAHQLATIDRRGTAHYLDITSFGMDVLDAWKKEKGEEADETLQALLDKYKKLKKWKEGQEKKATKLDAMPMGEEEKNENHPNTDVPSSPQ
jgi:hypothetical protein